MTANTHQPKTKVLHFVTGGFSGATAVAVSLVLHALQGQQLEPLLVLRRKSQTQAAQLERLRAQAIPLCVVPGWWHGASIFALYRLCRTFKPDVLVAHGFSEHLWGRIAGWLAGVPVLIQVEHNSRERYSPWRRWLSKQLAARSRWLVGVSEGVRQAMLDMGLPPKKCVSIPNGIALAPYADAEQHAYGTRLPSILMSARFARQKDHRTLLQALALLKTRGLTPPLVLIGGGKPQHRLRCEQLAEQLGITEQVEFKGFVQDVPALLQQHQIAVLSTHYEGMPLALVEAMAAGCVVVGSEVVGVRELLQDGVTGFLVRHQDAAHLADVLQKLLTEPLQAAAVAQAGRHYALTHLSREQMVARYEALFAAAL